MALTKVSGSILKDPLNLGEVSIGGTLTYEDVTNVDSVGVITARTGIDIVAGDLVIPDSIIHRSDANTKIRFPADDTFTVETAGSERLRITSAGNVGIGTDNPSQLLHLEKNSYHQILLKRVGASPSEAIFANAGNYTDIKNNATGVKFSTGATPESAMVIRSSGLVGIGTDSPAGKLHISSGTSGDAKLIIEADTDNNEEGDNPSIVFKQDGGIEVSSIGHGLLSGDQNGLVIANSVTNGYMSFATGSTNGHTNATERLRINSSGRITVNSTTSRNIGGSVTRLVQVEGTAGESGIAVVRNSNNASPPTLDLGKSRTNSVGGNTIVQDGDKLGIVNFAGADGTDLQSSAAQISGEVDGTPGSNDMPGRLVFKTTSDGSSSPTERMRISSEGYVTKPYNPMFKATMTATRTISSNGWHKIQFDTDTASDCFDVGNNFNTSNHRFTAPVTGYYQFGCNQRIDAGNNQYFRLAFYKNGSAGDGYVHGMAIYRDTDTFPYYSFSITSLIQLDASEYVEAYAYSYNDTSWSTQRESQFYGYLVG